MTFPDFFNIFGLYLRIHDVFRLDHNNRTIGAKSETSGSDCTHLFAHSVTLCKFPEFFEQPSRAGRMAARTAACHYMNSRPRKIGHSESCSDFVQRVFAYFFNLSNGFHRHLFHLHRFIFIDYAVDVLRHKFPVHFLVYRHDRCKAACPDAAAGIQGKKPVIRTLPDVYG